MGASRGAHAEFFANLGYGWRFPMHLEITLDVIQHSSLSRSDWHLSPLADVRIDGEYYRISTKTLSRTKSHDLASVIL